MLACVLQKSYCDLQSKQWHLDLYSSFVVNKHISILLYADDIALIATNEVDLQKMLDNVSEWCLCWKVMVNGDKTQIFHFWKGPSVPKARF